ncbi:hypothetical protein [Merdibacter massiliensis]|uniref:hypothetical protein n=1 Tax=Merdibacter massiliensis TaxID=1871030 RepID=UPI00096AB4AF|nr:hypothetical protein [Merdibacter massiliensis]
MFTWVTSSTAAPVVTISENAITLNAAAASYFNDIRYVMVGIDEENHQLAIRPIQRRELDLHLHPQDVLYKITVGKGYARVTNKAVVKQIQTVFHDDLDGRKLPAHFDEKNHLLIINFMEGEGDI